MKILLSSPVRNASYCLEAYLKSLENLKGDFEKEYYFITGNNEDQTEKILEKFLHEKEGKLEVENEPKISQYQPHLWYPERYRMLGIYRNRCLQQAVKVGAEYCSMVDSDIKLHPNTLSRLIEISEGEHVTSTVAFATWDMWNNFVCPSATYDYLLDKDGLTGRGVTLDQIQEDLEENIPKDVAISYMTWLIPTKLIKEKKVSFTIYGPQMEFKYFSKSCRSNGVRQIVDFQYPAQHLERSGISLVYKEEYK